MKPSFTPGIGIVAAASDMAEAIAFALADSYGMSDASCDRLRAALTKANLIAAAPDMAEALRLAFAFLEANYNTADMPDILPVCRAALIKAGLL